MARKSVTSERIVAVSIGFTMPMLKRIEKVTPDRSEFVRDAVEEKLKRLER